MYWLEEYAPETAKNQYTKLGRLISGDRRLLVLMKNKRALSNTENLKKYHKLDSW